MQTKHEIFCFGEFRLDVRERRIWRGQSLVSLPPKTFDLLVVMVKEAGRLLDKDYLIRTVWPDSYVHDANLSVHVANIRKALGRTPETLPFIETVPKAGYRFVAPVSHPAVQENQTPVIEFAISQPADEMYQIAPEKTVEQPLPFLSIKRARESVYGHRGIAALTLLSVLIVSFFLFTRTKAITEHSLPLPTSTHPLVSTPGLFLQPAFSPDGSELAYTWHSDTDLHQSIYVQKISGDQRSRLIDTGRDD